MSTERDRIVPAPGSTSPSRPAVALWVAGAVIVSEWTGMAVRHLAAAHAHEVPTSVADIARFASVKALLVWLVVGALLRWHRESFAALGLSLRDLRLSLVRGTLSGLVLFVVANVVLTSAIAPLFGERGASPIAGLFRDPREAPLWILAGLAGGGFAEELTRAFVLTRAEWLFGRAGLILALVIDSALFGLGHLYQGPAAAITAGVTGLACACLFLRRRRVTDAMVAHAVFDMLGIAGAYMLYANPR